MAFPFRLGQASSPPPELRDSANGASKLQQLSPAPRLLRRVLLLGLCVVIGCVVGFVGQHFTGSSVWFLPIPAFVLFAWLFVANPTECLPPSERSSHNGPTSR